MSGVAIVSGGMDSVTLAWHLKDANPNEDLYLVSFDYGQRHKKELEFAALCAHDVGAKAHHIVDLSAITPLISNSALTGNIDVPEGHYADESMALTVVPNRNAIMLAIATGFAVNVGAQYVAAGMHAGDHPIYPDCRPEFVNEMSLAMRAGNKGYCSEYFAIIAPFVNKMKQDIVSIGARLGVDYSKTWTCYKGLEFHCGVCGTCVERKEAFSIAGVVDPTYYA